MPETLRRDLVDDAIAGAAAVIRHAVDVAASNARAPTGCDMFQPEPEGDSSNTVPSLLRPPLGVVPYRLPGSIQQQGAYRTSAVEAVREVPEHALRQGAVAIGRQPENRATFTIGGGRRYSWCHTSRRRSPTSLRPNCIPDGS